MSFIPFGATTMNHPELAEKIGRFREVLSALAEGGPGASLAEDYRALRDELIEDGRTSELLPDFVIECRSPRDFWNYIQGAFSSYADRSKYITAQLLPIERQFRPERQKAPGVRPPEVRFEYSPVQPVVRDSDRFVSENRIAELRCIDSTKFDLRKLIRLCEELNISYHAGAFLATAMLTRSLLDHVPPIFGFTSFKELANNYGGSRSFREAMARLEEAARKIADSYLHGPIRRRETLPNDQQVNFAAEVDMLLGEVARKV